MNKNSQSITTLKIQNFKTSKGLENNRTGVGVHIFVKVHISKTLTEDFELCQSDGKITLNLTLP